MSVTSTELQYGERAGHATGASDVAVKVMRYAIHLNYKEART